MVTGPQTWRKNGCGPSIRTKDGYRVKSSDKTSTSERRQFERVEREIGIEVSIAGYQQLLYTQNVSDNGVFLKSDDGQLLPPHTIVRLNPQHDRRPSATLLGRVVWSAEHGMGIEYVGDTGKKK
jgi:hypothetical protein